MLLSWTCLSDVARHAEPSIRIACRVIATKERKSINWNLESISKDHLSSLPFREWGRHSSALEIFTEIREIWSGILRNKANLRDLIAATGLVILLKFDPNHRFFSLCDLEIWCMTSKNNKAPLLYYIKLCVSFQIHRWIQTEVTVRKRSIRVKIVDFLFCVTLKFDGWPWKTIGQIFYTTPSFVHHFKSIGEFKLELQSGNGLT